MRPVGNNSCAWRGSVDEVRRADELHMLTRQISLHLLPHPGSTSVHVRPWLITSFFPLSDHDCTLDKISAVRLSNAGSHVVAYW